MHSGFTGEVEEITVLLAGLEITISARPARSPSQPVSSTPVVSTTTGTNGTADDQFVLGYDPVSQALLNQALDTTGANHLARLPLRFLDYLVPRLRSANLEWTGAARVGRAFRAGILARLRLQGEISELGSEGIPFRNTLYVVLRAPGHYGGFWTPDYLAYTQAVLNGDNEFHRDSVSHGFPTRSEAEAYLVGAGRPWPRRL